MIMIMSDLLGVYEDIIENNSQAASTLKECSFDSANSVYLVEEAIECINFDVVKSTFARNTQISEMSSVDAFFMKDNKYYLIEFKNQHSVKWKDVRLKVHESLLILKNDLGINGNELYKIEVITVIKNNRKKQGALDQIRAHIKGNAKSPDRIESFGIFKYLYGIESKKLTGVDFQKWVIS